jgi:hypothetical protein
MEGDPPMIWHHFSQIFCINLPERTDRRILSQAEFDVLGIPVVWVDATPHRDGRIGLINSLLRIFDNLGTKQNVLIFEDDVQFLNDPVRHLEPAMKYLHHVKHDEYDLLYFGGNIRGCNVPETPNLNRITNTLAAHAICYNRSVFDEYQTHLQRVAAQDSIVNIMDINDMFLTGIQERGRCYMVNPIIATQRPGYSDLEKRYTDYSSLLIR